MTMAIAHRPVIQAVLRQHLDDAVSLRQTRSVLLRAPHVQLHRLRRLDDRLAAHLDGLMVAGEAAHPLLEGALAELNEGVAFVLGVLALQTRHAPMLTRLAALAAADPLAQRGWLSALGWVSAEDLQGTARALLGSKVPLHRAWALAACAMHRVDPGPSLAQAVQDADASVRARAWRVAGQLGRIDLADLARAQLAEPAAAWALTLWGQGNQDIVRRALIGVDAGQALPCEAAQRLAVLAAPPDWSRQQVRQLATLAESSPPHLRRMMRLVGWVGDPQVIPWLIRYMADDAWARLAGEAFSVITGADLASLDLERRPPDSVEAGPNDLPEDEHVDLDEDDSLPWPDASKVQAWWQAHAARFTSGQRYFAGQAPSVPHCLHILQTAGQRQRIVAAEYLCLLQPGSMQLPVAAPAWRQQRWLAAMSSPGA